MVRRAVLKRAAGIIGVVGGVAAVLWAMRDRLISVTISREPEPPTFRAVAPEMDSGVETIDGIGPTYAKRLAEAGVTTLADLAGASPDLVAESAGVSAARARAWIEEASSRA